MFGNKHARGELIAVVDIGSGSAAVALLERVGEKVSILASARSTLPYEKRTDAAIVSGVAAQITTAGEKVFSDYTRAGGESRPVSCVYAIVRAPWARSTSSQASNSFSTETKITDRLVSGIAKQALKAAQGIKSEDLLEASVVRVELNGYPTSEPAGKSAHEVVVTALVSDMQRDMRTASEHAIQKVFPTAKIAWRSSVRALSTILQRLHAVHGDYVIVDVESEATAIAAVKHGAPAEHSLAPLGVRAMVQKIAPKGLPEETLATIRMIALEECEGDACQKIAESMAKVEPEFARIYGEAMTKTQTGRRFPNDLVLIASRDIAPWLSKFFARIDFAQFTMTMQPYTVSVLSSSTLAPIVGSEIGDAVDLGIVVGAALVNIERCEC